jgi:hypothetical protein
MVALQISKLLNNPQSIKVFSFLVGFGIAILMFHKPIETHLALGVAVDEVEERTIRSEGKCYKYRAEDAPCEISDSK